MDLPEKLPSDFEVKDLYLPAVGLVLILGGVFLGSNTGFLDLNSQTISQDQAAENLVSLLETQSGQEYEVVSVQSENDLYKIDISDSENQLSTYYVTRNGELMTNSMNEFQELESTVEAQRNFSNCLQDREVVVYGNASQQATSLQIQILGGPNMVSPIYKDLNNQQNLQEAVQRGLNSVPGIYYNGSVISGVNQISQISEFTGCQFSPE